MVVTEFSTHAVAAPERFGLWKDATARSHMPNLQRSDDSDDFRGRARLLHLGDVQVSALAFPHLEITRTPRVIRRADPEVYQLNYFAHAHGTVRLGKQAADLRDGDLVLMDSSRPFHGSVRGRPEAWSHMTVQIPHGMLPLPHTAVRSLLAVPLDGRRGLGAVLARWLADLTAGAGQFTAADVSVLSSVTVDLLASVLACSLQDEDALDPGARWRALQVRVRDFIRRELADPGLTPETVAAAHGISLRTLYRLFDGEDLTVAAWIRRERLEGCRRDLADPRHLSRPVHAVAARWGLADPAHFSRAFRAAYGTSPGDYRNRALHGAVRAAPAFARGSGAS